MEIPNKTLQKHITNDRVAASYLLVDADIAKLRAIAVWFSRNYNPADVFWLTPNEGATTIQVAETLDFMQRAHLAAVGGKKLCIIADASFMTPAAQNKTLKTIEDTPPATTFMLLASNAETVLNTIKSRCITIYPDASDKSLTQQKMYDNNPDAAKIFANAEKLLACKTLDEALPLVAVLNTKENLPLALVALNKFAKTLPIPKRQAIITRLALINRNLAANCNPQNQFDTLLTDLF